MIQLALIIMCFFSSTFAVLGGMLGSRVITNSSGRVGPMLFKLQSPMRTPESNFDDLKIVNGSCIVGDSIVGSPCDAIAYHTQITFNEFPDYHLLRLKDEFWHYTVFFAEDCKFPIPKNGDIIVKKSIPLYRFLGGKTEENVIFALKGTKFGMVSLHNNGVLSCLWIDLLTTMGECSNLTVDKEREEIIYNATFSKKDHHYYETYTLRTDFKFISVTLDWNDVGEAPEVGACANSSNGKQNLFSNVKIEMEIIRKEKFLWKLAKLFDDHRSDEPSLPLKCQCTC